MQSSNVHPTVLELIVLAKVPVYTTTPVGLEYLPVQRKIHIVSRFVNAEIHTVESIAHYQWKFLCP